MTTAKTKAPTNKVFHFPKGDIMQADDTIQDAATPATTQKAKPAARKSAPASKKPAAKKTPAVKATAKADTKITKTAKPAKASKAEKPATDKKAAASKPPKTDGGKKAAVPAVEKIVQDKKQKAPKVEKVVRDSFTMPKSDYAKIAVLKQKCLDEGVHVKKSELLRAGLLLLEAAPVKRLVAAIGELETVKTGRPANT